MLELLDAGIRPDPLGSLQRSPTSSSGILWKTWGRSSKDKRGKGRGGDTGHRSVLSLSIWISECASTTHTRAREGVCVCSLAVFLAKTCCLPILLYGCETWRIASSDKHTSKLDVVWNKCFRKIFNACWRESAKPLLFYCDTVTILMLVMWMMYYLIF